MVWGVDFLLWRPLIAWSAQYREVGSYDDSAERSLFLTLLRRSEVTSFIAEKISFAHSFIRESFSNRNFKPQFLKQTDVRQRAHLLRHWLTFNSSVSRSAVSSTSVWKGQFIAFARWFSAFIIGGLVFLALPTLPKIAQSMASVSRTDWLELTNALSMTFLKVLGVIFVATLWTVPVGLWIGKSPKISRLVAPIIQNLAAFPAPVLYPLIAMWLAKLDMNPLLVATLLMTIGNQWYLLFNVVSGASRIPQELQIVAKLHRFSLKDRFFKLYFPAIFPSLLTGWITAAGGAWNASIVAEIVEFPGGRIRAAGIGAEITEATSQGQYQRLVAAVIVITIALIILNRTVWRSLHQHAEELKE
jgi:NitT/TauT family transport system permease protein